jgi:hypothetical protein
MKQLQDGDVVEVDADTGQVHILTRKVDQDISLIQQSYVSYEGGRACYRFINYLLNKAYIIDGYIDTSSIDVITLCHGSHAHRYYSVPDASFFLKYVEEILGGRWLLQECLDNIDSQKKILESLLNQSLESFSGEELVDIFQKFCDIYVQIAYNPLVLRMVDRGILIKIKDLWLSDESIALMCMPIKKTANLLEEESCIELISLIQQTWLPLTDIKIREAVDVLVKRFWYTSLWYYNETPKDSRYYEEILSSDTHYLLQEFQKKQQRLQEELQQRQIRLSKQPPSIQQLAAIAAEAAWLKDYYKYSINKLQFLSEPLRNILAIRTWHDVHSLKNMYPDEIIALLQHKQIPRDTIRSRSEWCVMYTQWWWLITLLLQDALTFEQKIIQPLQTQPEQNMRKGRIACKGRVQW